MQFSDLSAQTVISGLVTAVLIGVANYLQYRATRAKTVADAKIIMTAATEAKTVAAETREKVESVYQAVNGNGLMGEMRTLKAQVGAVVTRLGRIEEAVMGDHQQRPSDRGRL